MSRVPDSRSILHEILAEYDCPEKVQIRDMASTESLILKLAHGGSTNLQVITDFDFTLSKARDRGEMCIAAADVIRQSALMPDEFKARARERYDKLLPVEVDPTLSIEQKVPTVIASFLEGFADLVNVKRLNKKTLAQMISNADETCRFQLRDDCHTMLQCLSDARVPVLIFSAGFVDLIEGLLRKDGIYYPNINVIANVMEFGLGGDEEHLKGFKDPLIHTFNKNASVIHANSQYFDDLAHRGNVILLGDSIGDVSMADGVRNPEAIIKIGFLNQVDQQQLEKFLCVFDIVLLDDQTMKFINCLLRKISCRD